MYKRISETKHLLITDILALLDILPEKVIGHEVYYKNPQAPEQKTGSLAVNSTKNQWYDFATGHGGDLINLIQYIFGVDARGALEKLNEIIQGKSFFFSQPIYHKESRDIHIRKICCLENKALIEYMESRKIPKQLAWKYVQECYYINKHRNYFSVCFKNVAGGYELRNKYPKSKICVGTKAYSFVKGANKNYVNIFEGFMDFLSYLVIEDRQKPTADTIVLNGISCFNHCRDIIRTYPLIHAYLDHDQAGSNLLRHLYSHYPEVEDRSYLYKNCKDLNDYIRKKSYV